MSVSNVMIIHYIFVEIFHSKVNMTKNIGVKVKINQTLLTMLLISGLKLIFQLSN